MLPDNYDAEEAGIRLAAVIALAEAADEISPQFSDTNLDEYQVKEYAEPRCWKLSMVNQLTGEYYPLRVRIQGVISDLEFPPIRKPANTSAMERMRPHLRQGLKLTGLDCDGFQRVIENLEMVQVMFNGTLPPNMLQDWQPTYEGSNQVINMYNRFFIKRTLAPNRDKWEFNNLIDPDGVLRNMQLDNKFIHTYDNDVHYYQTEVNPDMPPIMTSPNIFRNGDIVETVVEFTVFPTGKNKGISVVVLKSVRMVSPDLRNKAAIINMRSRYKPVTFRPKRKLTDTTESLEKEQESRKRRKEDDHPDEQSSQKDPNEQEETRDRLAKTTERAGESTGTEGAAMTDVEMAQERLMRMHVSDPHLDP